MEEYFKMRSERSDETQGNCNAMEARIVDILNAGRKGRSQEAGKSQELKGGRDLAIRRSG